MGVLDQVIRIRCGIERRRSIGAGHRYFHLNKQVASLIGVRGGEIDTQFSIRYRQRTVIHLGKRAFIRTGGPCSCGILEIGVIRLGKRYLELCLTPRLSLFVGVECQSLDLAAYSDGFELVCQIDGLHLVSLRVGVIAINREMALCGISSVVNGDCLIGIHICAQHRRRKNSK